ncbi:CoA transferase [Acinetobacter baumannii]
MMTALNGLKVLDFSTLLPGPFATMYLADMGAEVIHIESPSRPDLIRIMPPYANGQATAHSYLNRNKQSIVLDLKDVASIDLIKAKISEFDIVIEQFRPDVMRRLGLDYATLAEINPRLIYCSITGYGQTGSYKDRAGHDINYLALAGIAGGSLHAVIAILAAVVERSRSGIGQYIDISMTDCVASLNSMAASATLAAQVEQAPEQGMLNGGIFYDYYMTQDGRYLSIGSLEPQFMAGLSAALDLPVLLQKGASLDEQDRQEVKQAIQEKIKAKTFKEWHEIFANLDVCVEPVLSLSEALNSPLAQQRGWIVNVPLQNNTPDTEPQIACPIKFSRSQMRYSFVGQKLGEGQW